MKVRGRFVLLTTLAILALPCASAGAAEFGFEPGSFTTQLSTGQAGAHPDLRTTFAIGVDEQGLPAAGTIRDMAFALPPGLLATAAATPTCPIARVLDFTEPCPLDTAVGRAAVTIATSAGQQAVTALVYNVTPTADEPAALAFNALAPVRLDIEVGPESGYRVVARAHGLSEATLIVGTDLTLWGVPADHSGPGPETDAQSGRAFGGPNDLVPRRSFLNNPTDCPGAPLSTSAAIDSWQDPGRFDVAAFELAPISGCGSLPFSPRTGLGPALAQADSPTGLSFELGVPQSDDPATLASSAVRRILVRLPTGVDLSPAAADGLQACSEAQVELGSSEAARCPLASKVATASIATPLLGDPLRGGLYLGPQLPEESGLARLFLVATGSGVTIKLPGSLAVDAAGRASVSFADLPRLPLEAVDLSFAGGARAAVTTPQRCGAYEAHAEVTPWSTGVPVPTSSSFTVSGDCALASRFAPALSAGAVDPVAGKASPYVLEVSSSGSEAALARIEAELPEGVMAKLGGVPLCGEAQAEAGSCPAASRIGGATFAIGAGDTPLYLPRPGAPGSDLYLAGPYRGAPYSVVIATPAQAGPFDFGTLTVRAGLEVDPETARVRITSGPLPQRLRGVPLPYRLVHLLIDRPGFMLNPTGCAPAQVDARLVSVGGLVASAEDDFQVAGCRGLSFAPRLTLRFLGPAHRGGHPRLRATLRSRGGANPARAAIVLPATELLENANIEAVCSRARYAARNCPSASARGRAELRTPLLDAPLRGPVYLRSSHRRLPDLVAALDGPIRLDLVAHLDSVHGRLRASFDDLPDAPLRKLRLSLDGGRRGLLVNSDSLCASPPAATVAILGHNGKRRVSKPVVRVRCPGR